MLNIASEARKGAKLPPKMPSLDADCNSFVRYLVSTSDDKNYPHVAFDIDAANFGLLRLDHLRKHATSFSCS